MKLELKNNNFILRTFKNSEAEILYKMIDENREHLGEWFSWVEKTIKIENTATYIKEENEKYKKEKGIYLGIWENEKLCGVINLDHIDLDNKNAEIGYWLSKDSVGKGIMYQACRALIKHAFETLNLHRLDINHIEENTRSRNLIERLGFKREGIRRESGLLHGKHVNHIQYGLLVS